MQVPPSSVLSNIVKHFLIIENNCSVNLRHRMFSDGNTGMVFNYKNPLIHQKSDPDEGTVVPPSFIYGQLSSFQTIVSQRQMGMLIAVFHPFGLSSLLQIPAFELNNHIIDSESFYPFETGNLVDQICQTPDSHDKIRIVENFLISKLKNRSDQNKMINCAVRLIQQQNGSLPVSKLITHLQVTERQLQRMFEEHIGLSPKRFSGITRIQHFLKLLRSNTPQTSSIDFAYDCGFYDQAHLIRELKKLSGITPTQYLTQTPLLAANLFQLPN